MSDTRVSQRHPRLYLGGLRHYYNSAFLKGGFFSNIWHNYSHHLGQFLRFWISFRPLSHANLLGSTYISRGKWRFSKDSLYFVFYMMARYGPPQEYSSDQSKTENDFPSPTPCNVKRPIFGCPCAVVLGITLIKI